MKLCNRQLVLSLALLIGVVVGPACSRDVHTVARDSRMDAIAATVSEDNLREVVTALVSFETRYPHQKQLAAAEYLYQQLSAFDASVVYQEYEYWGVTWRNVVATIPGRVRPDQTVIVCAHLDTKSEKRLSYAPGADDNASGCAAVVELCRLLAGHSFERTVQFVLFSREETGQNGSTAFLNDPEGHPEQIVAAINLDMLAYGDDDGRLDFVTRPDYRWLVDSLAVLARSYEIPAREIVGEECY
jgi:acetylornithine deacetylase/succinyl-diaminopimelate desuccinylase-like protein